MATNQPGSLLKKVVFGAPAEIPGVLNDASSAAVRGVRGAVDLGVGQPARFLYNLPQRQLSTIDRFLAGEAPPAAPEPPMPDFSGVMGGASSTAQQQAAPAEEGLPTDELPPAGLDVRAQPFEMSTKDGKVSWSGGGALPGSAMKATPEETAAWLKAHSAGQTGVGALLGYQPEPAASALSADPVGEILARDNQNAAASAYNTAAVGQSAAREARIGDANHINEIMRQQALQESSVRRLVEEYDTADTKLIEKLAPLKAALQQQREWQTQIANLNKLLISGQIEQADYEKLKDGLILQLTKSAEEGGKYSTDKAAAEARGGQNDILMSILAAGKQ